MSPLTSGPEIHDVTDILMSSSQPSITAGTSTSMGGLNATTQRSILSPVSKARVNTVSNNVGRPSTVLTSPRKSTATSPSVGKAQAASPSVGKAQTVSTSALQVCLGIKMSHLLGKPTWFPTKSDTNRPVQLPKRARILKFRI